MKIFRFYISLHKGVCLHYIKVSVLELHITKNAFVSFVADVFRGNLFSVNLSAAYSPADNWTV